MAKKTNISGLVPEKMPAGEPMQIILQKIDVRKSVRTEQDIPKWRNALRSAEGLNPRRQLLYALYADVEIDGHVESVVGKRLDAVTSANWQFVDQDGAPVDAINELIDSVGFDELLQEIVKARFWGYSILEPKFWKGVDDTSEMSAGLIPRNHYRVEAGVISYDGIGEAGINIREGIYLKTVMEVGRIDDLGLYLKAAPYQILKRGGVGDWAAFIQTFGSPIIDAVWDGVNEKDRQALVDATANMGPGGSIIRPAGTEVNFKENRAKDTGDAHGAFLAFLNKEISKALLGSTETTEASTSSGYAQSKTHQEEDDAKHDNDIAYVRKVLNSRFVRVLQAHGFDTVGGRFIVQGESQELSKKESFDIHLRLVQELGLPVDDDFFYETYGLPKPENYDQLKKQKQEAKQPPADPADPEPEPGKKKPGKQPKAEEEEIDANLSAGAFEGFMTRLRRFFGEAPAVTTGATLSCCTAPHIHLAAADEKADDALIRRLYDAGGKAVFDAELFWHTSGVLLGGFHAGWKGLDASALSIDPSFTYGGNDPAMLTAFEQNLFQFSAGKTLAMVQELNQLFRGTTSFEEFYQLAKSRTEVFNREWLETEYNTAALTGEAAATYHRLKSKVRIFPYWQYKTVGDHLVRPAHALLNGMILPANDPRWDKLFPPNGWNCRCAVAPRLANEFDTSKLKEMRRRADAYLNSIQGQKELATGWGVNRASSGQVFTANQQYVRKFKGKASKQLNALGPADFDLPSYSNAKKAGVYPAPPYEGTAAEFYDSLKEHQGTKALFDYNSRPLAVQKGNFDRHSQDGSKKRAHRTEWLTAMNQALNAPDEVWVNGSSLEEIVYVKYYEDRTMVVRGRIGVQGISLVSWFDLAETRLAIDKVRRGLLVFKK